MKNGSLKKSLYAYGTTLPAFQSSWTLKDLVNWCLTLINILIPVLIGGAVIVFFYGVVVFIAKSAAGDTKDRADSIKFMIWGIVGITVMASMWALVGFITNSFDLPLLVTPQFPTSAPN